MIDFSMADARALLPRRNADSHKGQFGHVLLIAGSRRYAGAAILATRAALRSGVGLVTLAIPEALQPVVAPAVPEAITAPLPACKEGGFAHAATEEALALLAPATALVMGPGLGQSPETMAFAQILALVAPVPAVLDADALNALAANPGALSEAVGPRIITPHPGEAGRLLRLSAADVQEHRSAALQRLATIATVAVLKGHHTLIAAHGGVSWRNSTGNHGLAKGGTGDVLAGLIGGLLAQGMRPSDAACLGVFVHGLAGDIAARRHSARGMTASDLVEALPDAWRAIEG